VIKLERSRKHWQGGFSVALNLSLCACLIT